MNGKQLNMLNRSGNTDSRRYVYASGLTIFIAAVLSSCTPAFKAHVDYSLSGKLVWPGPPEKPRIHYVWSLYSLLPEGKHFSDYLFGAATDFSDMALMPYLIRPSGIFIDSSRRLYVVDQGISRVTLVDLKTNDVRHFGFSGAGQLITPVAVTGDDEGRVYVTDSEARDVKIFDQSGDFLGLFAKEIQFERPTGITFERISGRFFILDTLNHRVHVLDREGNLKFSFGQRGSGDGEFNYPTHVTGDRDGNIYINDAMNFRIQIFSNEGQFISAFGRHGNSYADLDKPKGVAVDTQGHVYVVDTAQDMIKIFDRDGKLLLFFGETGRRKGKFMLPTGIFIDDEDIIYVADTYNMRIQAFKFLGDN